MPCQQIFLYSSIFISCPHYDINFVWQKEPNDNICQYSKCTSTFQQKKEKKKKIMKKQDKTTRIPKKTRTWAHVQI